MGYCCRLSPGLAFDPLLMSCSQPHAPEVKVMQPRPVPMQKREYTPCMQEEKAEILPTNACVTEAANMPVKLRIRSGMFAASLVSQAFVGSVSAFSSIQSLLGTLMNVLSFALGVGQVPALLLPEIFSEPNQGKGNGCEHVCALDHQLPGWVIVSPLATAAGGTLTICLFCFGCCLENDEEINICVSSLGQQSRKTTPFPQRRGLHAQWIDYSSNRCAAKSILIKLESQQQGKNIAVLINITRV
ncbi:hypothetical protein GOP47_0019237 [Adiantum capillus-veneris]|uniref:Uncharacterized protein n=1 Tax=Adiantum capillus-veneris TaxID=13818 RepID=A0A9D4UEQ2_ADICA|nr:hypothetical protein GOP47_0019237 [Adiantum capillus-veneris]